jgi:hypothetical protein
MRHISIARLLRLFKIVCGLSLKGIVYKGNGIVEAVLSLVEALVVLELSLDNLVDG